MTQTQGLHERAAGDRSDGARNAAVDRRTFLMRSAVVSAAVAVSGVRLTAQEQAEAAAAAVAPKARAASPRLQVAAKGKGPVTTVLEEFYKVGPGPSSSHTLGPMRITYDFYRRCTALPADRLAKATGLKVYLYGSLSATGRGHGTERACLAGLLGKEPATVDPRFLDGMLAEPGRTYSLPLGGRTFELSLADVVYGPTKGDWPHPNTMRCALLAGDAPVYELEYYSVGGGFIEWKGYEPPEKGRPKFPYATMKELRKHAEDNGLSVAQVMLANEVAVSGKSEEEVWAFIDRISAAMVSIVKAGLAAPETVLPGPVKLHTKAATVYRRATRDEFQGDRAVGILAACALAGSEENAKGHLVVTAPTAGSAGVMPAVVTVLSEGPRKVERQRIRDGFLAAAAVGYLCKHNATLAGAEGGCQAEIGVASAMAAALLAQAYDGSPQMVENAAESALEAHLGLTCDPVAGFVQIPCIERCAFGAAKGWTAFAIASNEPAAAHRVDLDSTIRTMAETGRDMSRKYKETSEGGLAVNVTLC